MCMTAMITLKYDKLFAKIYAHEIMKLEKHIENDVDIF